MARLNPLWYANRKNASWNSNEKAVSYLCDISQWTSYLADGAKWACGGPSVELLIDSYNSVKHDSGSSKVGYIYSNGGYLYTNETSNKGQSKIPITDKNYNGIYVNGEQRVYRIVCVKFKNTPSYDKI